MYNRNRLALLLGILVLAMAIVLRIRWQYNPPATDENIYVLDVIQASLIESLAPPEEDDSSIQTDTTVVPAVNNVITVTPTDQNQLSYTVPPATALVTGVQPNVLTIPTGYVVGFLFDDRYVLKQYDRSWQPHPNEITVASDMELINGQLPLAVLGHTGTEYVVVYRDPVSEGSTGVFIKHFTDLNTTPVTTALLTDLSDAAVVQAAVTTTGIALLVSEPTTAFSRLFTFDTAGQLLAEVTLERFGAARSVVGDNESWLVFGQTDQGLYIEKFSVLGSLQQAVSVVMPEAALPSDTLVSVVRSGESIVLLFARLGVVLADNLSSIHGRFSIASDQLYSHVMLADEQLYLTYNTSLSLTDYQIQIASWPLTTTGTVED